MPAQQSLAPGVTVASVASAATLGALIAIGHRLGSAGLPFATIAAVPFHRTASSAAAGLVFAGVVLHIFITIVWSWAFVWLVRSLDWRANWAAIAVAVAAFVISWITAWTTGSGLASVLPLGDRLVFAVIFAGSLVVGMRIAFSVPQSA